MHLTNLILMTLLTSSLASCTISAKPETHSELEIFRVGEVEVRLYQDRERMVRQLPPLFALLEATRVGNIQIQVSGYFDPQTKTIYAVNDAKTVIHEFKHYLEPQWRHGRGPERSDKPSPLSNPLGPNTLLRTETVSAVTAIP